MLGEGGKKKKKRVGGGGHFEWRKRVEVERMNKKTKESQTLENNIIEQRR